MRYFGWVAGENEVAVVVETTNYRGNLDLSDCTLPGSK
jgi:hypothetical protein